MGSVPGQFGVCPGTLFGEIWIEDDHINCSCFLSRWGRISGVVEWCSVDMTIAAHKVANNVTKYLLGGIWMTVELLPQDSLELLST